MDGCMNGEADGWMGGGWMDGVFALLVWYHDGW